MVLRFAGFEALETGGDSKKIARVSGALERPRLSLRWGEGALERPRPSLRWGENVCMVRHWRR
ncbi:MAG: hypothetical protein JO262_01375 [Solirubrobacterales bacterium]|nr:hypothetical protein [Solirubrobacterales bacterium]